MATTIPIDDTLPTDPDAIVARIFDPDRPTGEIVPLYHQLRTLAPVHRSGIERLGRPWIVTRHADAAWVAREKGLLKDERLVDQLGGDPDSFFVQTMKRMMNFIPAPRHTRLRHLVNDGFSKGTVERLRPGVHAHVHRLIDAFLPRGLAMRLREAMHNQLRNTLIDFAEARMSDAIDDAVERIAEHALDPYTASEQLVRLFATSS